MMTLLPRWVEYGAFLLAGVAGFANVIGLLGFEHQAISHLSGTASQLGSQLGAFNSSALHLLAIIASFLLGAAFSGVMLQGRSLELGKHYDTLLLVEGVLFFASAWLLEQHGGLGHYFASAACGIQNALVTTYSGAIIRTTHITGIITDLGIMLGKFVRSGEFDKRKALLFCLITSGFIVGGWLGTLGFSQWHFSALMVPAVVCIVLAVLYRIYRQRHSS